MLKKIKIAGGAKNCGGGFSPRAPYFTLMIVNVLELVTALK